MKKVAIICAAPHFEFNPGMHSVDLGAFHFFKTHFTEEVKLTFYIMHAPEAILNAHLKNQLPFTYEILLNKLDELYQNDLIVFWGDFLHNELYHENLAKRLVNYNLVSEDKAAEAVNQHLFLTDAPLEVLQKTIVFGSNFFINPPASELDQQYLENCKRFFSAVNKVWVRDILSSLRIAQLTKNYTTNQLGIDCSFFFNKEIIEQNYTPQNRSVEDSWLKKLVTPKKKYNAGIFLGRMHGKFEPLFLFANALQKELHASMHWIHWFWQNEEFYTSVKHNLPAVTFTNEESSLLELYASLKSYDFIITDTYHLCLNAWKMGVPAICIGSATSQLEGTLTDKKKEFFFDMYEAQDFYLFLEDIKDPMHSKQKIALLADKLANKALHQCIFNNLQSHKNAIEIQLHETVKAILM